MDAHALRAARPSPCPASKGYSTGNVAATPRFHNCTQRLRFGVQAQRGKLPLPSGLRRTAPGGIAVDRPDAEIPEATAEQFRLLVGAVKDYAIFLLDPTGRVVSWNAGAERIKGYTEAEILGEHFSRFYPPEDIAAGRPAAVLRKVAAEGRYQEYGWRLRKDGTRFFGHMTITALYDQAGSPRGFAKVTQDVTEQYRQRQALRESEARFRTSIEHLLDPVVLLTAVRDDDSRVIDFRYDYINPAHRQQATGPAAAELGRTLLELHPEAADSGLLDAYQRVIETGRPLIVDEFRYREPGSGHDIAVLDIRAAKLDDGIIITWREVSARLEAERQLIEAEAEAEVHRRLQAGLLPSLSLTDPTVRLLTRYQPGTRRALLGADFYDALQLDDGTIAILLGDVAGHGPEEASVAVALRFAWRALVRAGQDPAELLSGLDRVLVHERPSEELFATVVCGWVTPDRAQLTLAVAGHPSPVLIRAGEVELLELPRGPALGIYEQNGEWPAAAVPLSDAWTLVCYTDGLVEGLASPSSTERFGIEQMMRMIANLLDEHGGLDQLLDRLLRIIQDANGAPLADDVAILCLSHLPRNGSTRPGRGGVALGRSSHRSDEPAFRHRLRAQTEADHPA
jgi:PAS domain S-box-containing protein